MSRSSSSRGTGSPMRRVSRDGARPQKSKGAAGTRAPQAGPELSDFDPDDVDPQELRDFISADWVEVKADPGFRERLRSQLWEMLSGTRAAADGDDDQ